MDGQRGALSQHRSTDGQAEEVTPIPPSTLFFLLAVV